MAASKKLDAPPPEIRLEPGPVSDDISIASKANESAGLKSWLEGGDDFLTWLNEGAEADQAAANEPGTGVEASSVSHQRAQGPAEEVRG